MSITIVISQRAADHEFGEILDGQMVTTGRAVFSILALELRRGDASRVPVLLDEFVRHRKGVGDWIGENTDIEVYDSEFYFQLDDASGHTVFSSRQPALVHRDVVSPGLFKIGSDDDQWHLFSLQDEHTGYTFYTGQSQKLRHELSSESIEYILLPFILVTLFILGTIWAGTRYGLKPLVLLTQQLESRSPTMLDTIELGDNATELRPLIMALNRLLTRIRTSLATERQFNMDVSHELRTPLAGITANLDAARCLSDSSKQKIFLDNIQSCVDNTTQITDGLLLLSRIKSNDLDTYFGIDSVDIQYLIQKEIDKHIAINPAERDRIQYHCKPNERKMLFKGPESLAEIAFTNILDNALKYSKGKVDIELFIQEVHKQQTIIVSVSDNGPGISSDKLELVFRRFYRANDSATKGFGLGLALVKQIMIALGGSVKIANRSQVGLHVTLTFPMA